MPSYSSIFRLTSLISTDKAHKKCFLWFLLQHRWRMCIYKNLFSHRLVQAKRHNNSQNKLLLRDHRQKTFGFLNRLCLLISNPLPPLIKRQPWFLDQTSLFDTYISLSNTCLHYTYLYIYCLYIYIILFYTRIIYYFTVLDFNKIYIYIIQYIWSILESNRSRVYCV